MNVYQFRNDSIKGTNGSAISAPTLREAFQALLDSRKWCPYTNDAEIIEVKKTHTRTENSRIVLLPDGTFYSARG